MLCSCIEQCNAAQELSCRQFQCRAVARTSLSRNPASITLKESLSGSKTGGTATERSLTGWVATAVTLLGTVGAVSAVMDTVGDVTEEPAELRAKIRKKYVLRACKIAHNSAQCIIRYTGKIHAARMEQKGESW